MVKQQTCTGIYLVYEWALLYVRKEGNVKENYGLTVIKDIKNRFLFRNYCDRGRDLIIELGSILSDKGKRIYSQGTGLGTWWMENC